MNLPARVCVRVQLCLHVGQRSCPPKRQRTHGCGHLPVEKLHWVVGRSLFLSIGSGDMNLHLFSFMCQGNQMHLSVAGNCMLLKSWGFFSYTHMNLLHPPAHRVRQEPRWLLPARARVSFRGKAFPFPAGCSRRKTVRSPENPTQPPCASGEQGWTSPAPQGARRVTVPPRCDRRVRPAF